MQGLVLLRISRHTTEGAGVKLMSSVGTQCNPIHVVQGHIKLSWHSIFHNLPRDLAVEVKGRARAGI